jgi:serine/threonine-protein kinase HipA
MKKARCLYCYQPLQEMGVDFHEKCSRIFFGTPIPPILDYDNDQMRELAKELVLRSIAITGVQPKLSLTIEKVSDDPKRSRFTIVGLWGAYILKPPTQTFPFLPENEDLTMHLAEVFNIPVAMHSLIRLKSGELAYITKRFDRTKKGKLPLEDMCQLTETLTTDKYKSSMERVGRCIEKYSTRPGLDKAVFFEHAIFGFLSGNADMHLKNFSLLTTTGNDIVLAPAYDLVSTKIVIPDDKEEMALTINARKRKLKRSDFDSLARYLKIPEKAMGNSYAKFFGKISEANKRVDISFLPDNLKEEYKRIIKEGIDKLQL